MDFTEAFDALRETHTELSVAASKLDRLGSIWDSLPPGVEISVEDRKRVVSALQAIPEQEFGPTTLLDTLWEVTAEDPWGPMLAMGAMKKFYRPAREPIFHGAMLISTVAQLEGHLSTLAENYYRAAPAALHDVPKEATKEFSLKDLQALGSIELAVESAIQNRVSKLSFGSLTEWRRFFKDRMSIDFADLGTPWDVTLEIFERRHCLVHSEGRASARYTKTVNGVSANADLRPDEKYVTEAIDALEVLGTLLHASVWRKFTKTPDEIVSQIESTAFSALKEGRWAFSLPLYRYWQELPLSNQEQMMARVNIWLARKGIEGLEAIREEVEAWDVSGYDDLYVFAKACILDDLDEAFAMVTPLIERDKLSGADLATWPLTASLRADPRIREYSELVRGYLATEAEASILAAEDRLEEDVDEAHDAGIADAPLPAEDLATLPESSAPPSPR